MTLDSEFEGLIARSFTPAESRDAAALAAKLFARADSDLANSAARAERLAELREVWSFIAARADRICVSVGGLPGDASATVVTTLTDDHPFIVDSLLEYFQSIGASIRSIYHPILRIARDSAGNLAGLERANRRERRESLTRTVLDLPFDDARAVGIRDEVRAILHDVDCATSDFEAMKARALAICAETAGRRELAEVREFIRWMVNGGFVFLGYRRLRADADRIAEEADSGLGIMRDHDEARFPAAAELSEIEPARRSLLFEGPAMTAGKTAAESRVHRRAAMDSIMIRRADAKTAVAFDHFVGLFTSRAYAEDSEHIPVLREKLAEILKGEGAAPNSFDYRQIVGAFNSFPKDELLRAGADEIARQLRPVLDVGAESATRMIVIPDAARGHVIVLVVVPRDSFSADLRLRIQQFLAGRLGGATVYYYLAMGDTHTARMHFCFAAPVPKAALVRELEAEVRRLAHSWPEQLADALIAHFGKRRGRELARRWSSAFDSRYQAANSVAAALRDIEQAEQMEASGTTFAVSLNISGAQTELRVVGIGEPPMLSAMMPTLNNFALEVLAESAYELRPESPAMRGYVESFAVRGVGGRPLSDTAGAALLADAIVAARTGLAVDDSLGALVLSAGLRWREVALMRAYLAVGFQTRLAPSRNALSGLVLSNPELTRALLDLFVARLDPSSSTEYPALDRIRERIAERLSQIDNLADDRCARALNGLIEATVRTNYFNPIPSPDPYIALKFESAKIFGPKDAAPLYEIHVSSPRMEGCHLRAGEIARGGIRFSDRPDDYRTEILDLMKIQIVKNAIIVPTGSKGGFVLRGRAGAGADSDGGEAAYRTLINAMLDLTDNRTPNGAVVNPSGLRVLDAEDPYLVVAADKGTSTFSDIANSIAVERGFWLGDAFASGGEHGYDHKRIGITARGAWESARRHLREAGRDLDRGAPVTVAGIGDMSGDVFGNAMILSRNVALVAAFDRRHIFIDPAPDRESSWRERQRMFKLPRSSWADYDRSLISAGGGIWPRSAKRIELNDAMRALLAAEASALDGEAMVAAILRAPVDMIYNGGIGTYVRASSESDDDVGDRANDACRIAAAELRAKVVVEGGNLGFTNAARIEYALGGGRINTDAIDNSAGVDMSDHEVNLKIALTPPVARGDLSIDDRNAILAECAADVASAVIANNRDQVLSLSLEQIRSRLAPGGYADHASDLVRRSVIRSDIAALPTRAALDARRAKYAGLARPELAVIAAYTKIDLASQLKDSKFIRDPYLNGRFVVPYFPASVAARFPEAVAAHSLHAALAATQLANEMVDLMGSTFAFELERDTGRDGCAIARAWLVAADIVGAPDRIAALKDNRAIAPDAELAAIIAMARAVGGASRWVLETLAADAKIGPEIARLRPAFTALESEFESMLAASERDRFERSYRELRASVGDGELAHALSRIEFANHILEIIALAHARGDDAVRVAAVYFGLEAQLDFGRIDQGLAAIQGDDMWTRRARTESNAELRAARNLLTASALDDRTRDGAAAIESMLSRCAHERARAESILEELRAAPALTPAALHVAIRALSRLAEAADSGLRGI